MVEKKVSVDWKKWDKKEHPGMPVILASIVFSVIVLVGLLYDYPYVSLGIACFSLWIINVFIKNRFGYKKHDKEAQSVAS